MNHGYVKVAAAIPNLKVADCAYNSAEIEKMIEEAEQAGVEIVCFPELSITAYSCGDLFFQELLQKSAMEALQGLVERSAQRKIVSIVGLPVSLGDKLFNTAAIFGSGRLVGFVPKTFLPNYNEYYEKRWFASANELSVDTIELGGQSYPFTPRLVVGDEGLKFSVEICEDLWAPIPPSSYHSIAGAHLIFNLSASNEVTGKHAYRKSLVAQQSARCIAGYVYAGAGCGESSTDLVFSGNALIYENGALLNEAERFSFSEQMIIADVDTDRLKSQRMKNTSFDSRRDNYTLTPLAFNESQTPVERTINPRPFVSYSVETLNEIFSIQIGGLAKRMTHTNIKNLVVGVSGGLDSTLALLVCAKTCDKLNIPRSNVVGITMPGFGTGKRTLNNALSLMRELYVTSRTIDITQACTRHFKDIHHPPELHNLTFENTQARERTQILMDVANQCNGLVVGTGDMSELALGWATYNGDHMSMYGVNSGVPKTLVQTLVLHVADSLSDERTKKILLDIINTPISPELLPVNKGQESTQITEDIVGPYELHDFFLFWMLRYGYSPEKICFMAEMAFSGKYQKSIIVKWMKVFYKRFFAQQFKRSCLPDGPKVGSVNLSPRGDWRMPSDAAFNLWIEKTDNQE